MFSPIKGKQTTFVYGPEIYEKLVSRDHLLYKINESIDFTFINEECRNLYSENMGRPVTNTPEIMFRSAIIQSLNDYSDREMEYEARYNIMVKWFIGLNLSLIHISEPTRQAEISYAVFCLKKKKKNRIPKQ